MRRFLFSRVVALAVVLSSVVHAAEPVPLSSLSWLAGSWKVEKKNGVVEEQWTTPAGGMMLGVSRTIRDGKVVEFEFVRIEQRGDSLVYVAQPGGRPPTEFKVESATADEVVFANLQHDFPKRIRYKRNGDDAVTARVEDETGKKAIEFGYVRVR